MADPTQLSLIFGITANATQAVGEVDKFAAAATASAQKVTGAMAEQAAAAKASGLAFASTAEQAALMTGGLDAAALNAENLATAVRVSTAEVGAALVAEDALTRAELEEAAAAKVAADAKAGAAAGFNLLSREARAARFEMQAIGQLTGQRIPFALAQTVGALGSTATSLALTSVAAAGVVGILTKLGLDAAKAGAQLNDMAVKTGFSVETLNGLKVIAAENDESFSSLAVTFARADRNIQEGIINPGQQAGKVLLGLMGSAQAVERLGLLPMEQRIQVVAQRINALTDIGDRNIASQALFGRGWTESAVLLQKVAREGFQPAIDKAKELGTALSPEQVAQLKAVEVAWQDFKLQLSGFALDIGLKVIDAARQISIVVSEGRSIVTSARSEFLQLNAQLEILRFTTEAGLAPIRFLYDALNELSAGAGYVLQKLGLLDKAQQAATDAAVKALPVTEQGLRAEQMRAQAMDIVAKAKVNEAGLSQMVKEKLITEADAARFLREGHLSLSAAISLVAQHQKDATSFFEDAVKTHKAHTAAVHDATSALDALEQKTRALLATLQTELPARQAIITSYNNEVIEINKLKATAEAYITAHKLGLAELVKADALANQAMTEAAAVRDQKLRALDESERASAAAKIEQIDDLLHQAQDTLDSYAGEDSKATAAILRNYDSKVDAVGKAIDALNKEAAAGRLNESELEAIADRYTKYLGIQIQIRDAELAAEDAKRQAAAQRELDRIHNIIERTHDQAAAIHERAQEIIEGELPAMARIDSQYERQVNRITEQISKLKEMQAAEEAAGKSTAGLSLAIINLSGALVDLGKARDAALAKAKWDELTLIGRDAARLPPAFQAAAFSLQNLRVVGVGALDSLQLAMASGIAQAVVYGQSVGAAMEAALKATLASIASEAIVQALKATAVGFLRLAEFEPAAAAAAFTSAAEWAAIGGVAAAVGAAIPGGAAAGAGGGVSSRAPRGARAITTGPEEAAVGGAATAAVGPALAPGYATSAQSPPAALTVVIMGRSDAALWLSETLNTAIENQNIRLVASHVKRVSSSARH